VMTAVHLRAEQIAFALRFGASRHEVHCARARSEKTPREASS